MIVGIDLGTTHSLIGVHDAEGGRLFANPHGSLLTPSVVSIDDDGTLLVGQPARERLVSHPHHSVAAFKRWMGSPRETKLGQRSFRPEELSALILRSLIADAEAALGSKIEEAVISVPAYFSDAQRKATRVAGELAGIRVERLINEPTAAALAYGLQERGGEGRVLVLDLGGGTFDVSLLEMFDGVVEVHASAGDNFLGGEDFLQVLVDGFCSEHRLDPAKLAPGDSAQLRRRIEQLKRDLSTQPQGAVSLNIAGQAYSWELDESRFAQLAEPLLQRMRLPIERALRDAKLRPSELDDIVLVGGAVRMPMISRLATRMLGRLPLRHVNPDHAIALGAVVAAGLKSRDESLREVVLTDVCPYTLGTQVARQGGDGQLRSGYFHPIIPRNSVVPVSREDRFHPIHEQQTQLVIDVYQGENPMVERNIKLGELRIALDPKRPRSEQSVLTRFTYDVDGLLQVEVIEEATGKRHELILEQNPGLLDRDEIARRLQALAELKVHPRDQQQNLALLARVERVYEEYIDARQMVQRWLDQFREVLESQDLTRIERHREELAQALDELEARA
ncbi:MULTISPECIES: molecular chaperone HscC [Xanthomonas]|uniref:Molecular chaperone HscC n=1 Tax=Xanthomonas rydalmerensis TaxID=3046274 RepID=A0ABZ0JS74_9XANT|nr:MULTISPECIES: molecular chaperone HscC [unclassified Xanthomonas]MBB5874993.1 molecular chaperone HscC [Xanthomonas sp. 3498]WOS41962.1 molecular chaperone HscC [Xanthomonas sp. DM-2023]WOS46148.1 molecular chaperone HscC [Xanthomonas sp. DM-2023]WOS50326.1 molecular chaperone HscC [Xanthomonas sp. DM-2023]WOS54506.1 molecular chaperone HscC [Xanthomonas sp. DM-2023]